MDNNNNKVGIILDWVYVYKKYIPNLLYEDLTYTINVRDNGMDIPLSYNLYEFINNDIIAIPRYCNYAMQLNNHNYLKDGRTNGEDINIDVKIPPRDNYQKSAIECILNNENGIIHAKTGFGKTYVAINAIATLKKKALIIMHKKDLMQQWKDDILTYTNLNDDDIQIFTGNESKFKSGKAITITTVQNLGEKLRNNNINVRDLFQKENFGITFIDECHTNVGPYSNTMASKFIFSKRLYGLSATPKRGDDGDKAINYVLGNIIYTDERKMLPVYVSFAPINIKVPDKTKNYLFRFKNTFTLQYSKWLQKNEEYVNYCSNIIMSLIKINKKLLVVAQYKDILQTIYDNVYSLLGDKKMNVDKIRIVHGTSKAKFKDLKEMTEEEIEEFNCIFTTSSFFSAGLSINWLNTIVYLTPPSANSLSAIPQLVGRIVREYKNKEYVNIVDIFNKGFNIDESRMRNREKSYKKFNYIVLNIGDEVLSNTDIYIENVMKMCNIITNTNKYSFYSEDNNEY